MRLVMSSSRERFNATRTVSVLFKRTCANAARAKGFSWRNVRSLASTSNNGGLPDKLALQSAVFLTLPKLPEDVTIYEVGPRDGLQNERDIVPTETKVRLVDKLSATGLRFVEVTSFVSPKWVPQMADATNVLESIDKQDGVRYPVLIPNMEGFNRALEAGVQDIAIFSAASESFSKMNMNKSIEESLNGYLPVCEQAKSMGIPIRGYVSCVLGCPYEGYVDPDTVAKVSKRLLEMGCYEISLGDTIGVGHPGSTTRMLKAVFRVVPREKVAVHFHDTVESVWLTWLSEPNCGVQVVDSSISGLGGCPYARGASGNVATEDVVYMFNEMGVRTGIEMDSLLRVSSFISTEIGRPTQSKAGRAISSKLHIRYEDIYDEPPLYQH